MPLGAPPDVLARIAEIVTAKGAKFVLDSSGVGLSGTLERVPVHLVKPSLSELESLAGRRLDRQGAEDMAADLVKRGRAEIVAVTMGAAGALIATRDGIIRLKTPKVDARSAVGAGDSFVAGMTLALSEGKSVEDAALYGVAAGAAAVLAPGSMVCRREDVERFHAELIERNTTAVRSTARDAVLRCVTPRVALATHASFDVKKKTGARTMIVVTGGSGKVGRACVRDLMDHGYDVTSIDMMPPPGQTQSAEAWRRALQPRRRHRFRRRRWRPCR